MASSANGSVKPTPIMPASQVSVQMEETRDALLSELVASRQWERVAVTVTQGVSVALREHALLAALQDCQWDCLTQLLQQGVSLELRDQVLMEAVRHSQWSSVLTAATLGVSAGHRDTAFHKAARYKQWGCVDRLLALGVSQSQKDAALQRAVQHQQWDFVSRLVQAGISHQQRGLVIETALDKELWQLVAQIVDAGVRQQQRDMAAQEAVRLLQGKQLTVTVHGELWQLVDQLVETGISQQQRDTVIQAASQHGQWHLVYQLVQAGVSLEQRNHAIIAAVHHQQWSCVVSLLKASVSFEQRDNAVKEFILRSNLWDQLHEVVSLCDDPTQKELAVLSAIEHSQWSCVMQLVQLGLNQTLKEHIVDMARTSIVQTSSMCGTQKQLDCAIEVLRQGGVSDEHKQWVVDELFRQHHWQRVLDLLTEGTLAAEMTRFTLLAALTYKEYYAFMAIVRTHCVTDLMLSEAMTSAVYVGVYNVVHSIIRTTRSGLRVFKQLCLKQHWMVHAPADLIKNLVEVREVDLAFFLAATHFLWDSVIELYDRDLVTKKTRKLALQLAIRHRAWSHVTKMTDTSDLRRIAFWGAVRQGEWKLALQLCEQGLAFSKRYIIFAIQICLINGQWEFVTGYCQRYADVSNRKTLLKHAIETTVKCDLLNCFLNISHVSEKTQQHLTGETDTLRIACDAALGSGRSDYVLSLCLADSDNGNRFYWRKVRGIAMESGIKAEKWDLVQELVDEHDAKLSEEQFVKCIQKIVPARDCWYKCAPFLDACCKDTFLQEIEEEWMDIDTNQASHFVDWCRKTAFGNLALIVSLLTRNWSLATAVVDELGGSIAMRISSSAVEFALDNGALDTTVSLLQYAEVDEYFLDFDVISDADLKCILMKCQEKRMHTWVVHIAGSVEKWDVVDATLEICEDQTLINKTLRHAQYSSQWNLIMRHIDRSSLDEEDVYGIIRYAVLDGNDDAAQCVKGLLEKVDPVSNTGNSSPTLLNYAVQSSGNKVTMLRLCLGAGLSTRQRQLAPDINSPVRQAVKDHQFPLVRLLHESGACSNSELYQLKTDATLRGQLERQGHGELSLYVDQTASNPLPLQNLCRLAVASCIGCRPGRRDRVASLDVPWCVKDYLCFTDFHHAVVP